MGTVKHTSVGTYIIGLDDAYLTVLSFLTEIGLDITTIDHVIRNITYEVFDNIETDELSYMMTLASKPNLTYYDNILQDFTTELLEKFTAVSRTYILDIYFRVMNYVRSMQFSSNSVRYEYNLVDIKPNFLVFTIYAIPTYS